MAATGPESSVDSVNLEEIQHLRITLEQYGCNHTDIKCAIIWITTSGVRKWTMVLAKIEVCVDLLVKETIETGLTLAMVDMENSH
jgi:predicted aspartyl protease